MSTEPPTNSEMEQQTPSVPELDPGEWRHALIPWKDGGKAYTYLVPPGVPCVPGDWALIERPNGSLMFYQVQDVVAHEPTTFQLKPIANVWSNDEHQRMVQAVSAQGEGAKITILPQDDYERWKAEAADMFVEGR